MSPLSFFVHFLSPSQQTVEYSSIRPRPMPSKSLAIHQSRIILPSQTLRVPNDEPHKSPCTCTIKLGRSSTALYVRQSLVTQEPSSTLWKVQERATCINRKTTSSAPYGRQQKIWTKTEQGKADYAQNNIIHSLYQILHTKWDGISEQVLPWQRKNFLIVV